MLARVGVQHEEFIGGSVDIRLVGVGVADEGCERIASPLIAGDGGNDVTLCEKLPVLLKVCHQRHGGVREDRSNDSWLDH